ncbi:ankyrin repeat and SOCS box protein 3-like [Pectinophora gossypiella]|uniref:ankyrin repeat and SOCS box protein 3-like n=1 Tax=Pectinophora gossypiella TaxID=13191 RepID=UPI00214F1331|nr:ankyrin repeat and SOCS box protein 3-like [Pectinophora gossypiella]
MDFSSLNPVTSNALNFAARRNDFATVERLLRKLNPSCIDNRGWTCLHEAAASDSYESLMLILQHPDCRPLAETHEGHTALYLACRETASLKTIKALLESAEDIANYGSTESVTPLHIASSQGRVDLIQLLIDHGAIVNVQDFDGDTPMHDATLQMKHEAVDVLLHAGGDPDIKNEPHYIPFHLACYKGCYDTIKVLYPFVTDINQQSTNGDTPLILAVQGYNDDVVRFLLKNGADPHIKNVFGELAMNMALCMGYESIFNILLEVTDIDKMSREIILFACKPHYFKLDILEALLKHDIGPEFFDFHEVFHITLEEVGPFKPAYLTNAPLNSYLNICEYIYKNRREKFRDIFYLFLMRGVAVDALDVNECPPLVYMHYCAHNACFVEVFEILCEFDCNVDHCTSEICEQERCIPDAFLASLTSNPVTTLVMLPYSLYLEPVYLLHFAYEHGVLCRISPQIQHHILLLIDASYIKAGITADKIKYSVLPLKHLARCVVRKALRNTGPRKTTKEYLRAINTLPIPPTVRNYLRYM